MTPSFVPAVEAAFYDALRDDDAELLYETAPCGYLSTSPDGLITKVNLTLLTMLDRTRDEVVGSLHFTDILTGGGRIFHETHYAPMLRMHGSVREIALDLVRGDGSLVPVLINSVLDRDADGRPRAIRTAVFDATERRAYERELQRQKERAEKAEAQALELSRTLQQTLLPPSPPHIPQLDVGAVFRPGVRGVDVGGDFYDVFQVGPDEWVVIIGDVCGKGIAAATFATLTRYTLRAMSVDQPSPSEALRRTNDVLRAHSMTQFSSAVCIRLRSAASRWHGAVSSAGHPLPLLRSPTGTVISVGSSGTLLNIVAAPSLSDTELTLDAGSTLLLCTDGVAEGRRGADFYGDARIVEHVRSATGTAQHIAEAILRDCVEFQRGTPRDDIAVVVLQVPR